MTGKTFKLEEESISEILIADTITELKKMFSDLRVATTTLASEIIHPTLLLSVFLWPERAQCINVPDVMWARAWCLV
jgi:hypothetical protein